MVKTMLKLQNVAKNALTNNLKLDEKYMVTILKICIYLKVFSYPNLKGVSKVAGRFVGTRSVVKCPLLLAIV